jgi:hypothetical protein
VCLCVCVSPSPAANPSPAPLPPHAARFSRRGRTVSKRRRLTRRARAMALESIKCRQGIAGSSSAEHLGEQVLLATSRAATSLGYIARSFIPWLHHDQLHPLTTSWAAGLRRTSASRCSARALERPWASTGDGGSSARCAASAAAAPPPKTVCVDMSSTHAPTFCAADPSAPGCRGVRTGETCRLI